MKFNAIIAASILSGLAFAHPEVLPRDEILRRGALSRRCAGAAAQFNSKRYAKRMAKRAEEVSLKRADNASTDIDAPYYDVIQNDTCVLTPDVTAGPYVWPRSQTLRQDMSEDQPGVPLTLDIGILDMATCEPLEGVLVSMWHCNATGSYSSFTGLSPNTAFPTLLQSLNITDFEIGVTDLHTDNTTFLRGMWPTDDAGILEMKTIFPGFYTQRAIHIHTEVYTNWTLHSNGTVDSGTIVSVGQLYFEDDLEEQIMALEPYASHTEIERTTNDEDTVYSGDTVGGYYPVVSIVAADGENVENGMIGYITMGVDTTSVASLSKH